MRTAVNILKEVVEREGHFVAFLNLADALWQQRAREEGRKYYNLYAEEFKKRFEDRKMPDRVIERLKED